MHCTFYDDRALRAALPGSSRIDHTFAHVCAIVSQITPMSLEETVAIEPDFEIRPYYAGHVLGAAMFYVRVGQQSFVYTGDYNMTPDRHLGSASCDKVGSLCFLCRYDVSCEKASFPCV